jgi:hypothetical protein
MNSKIPLNMSGETININGFQTPKSQWASVFHCAQSLYENDGFNEEQYDDVAYRCSEIIETLRLQSENVRVSENESSQYDPQVDAFFELFDESAIEMIIDYAESQDWNFKDIVKLKDIK